jgi:hypothetical protein
VQHDAKQSVKPKPKALEPPDFMRFLQRQSVNWKKPQKNMALCTFVAYIPNIT